MLTEIRTFSECHIDWAKAVTSAMTQSQLLAACMEFGELVQDAYDVVKKMSDREFRDEWLPGLRLEVRGTMTAGDTWLTKYGCVMMPGLIATVGYLCQTKNLPFGLAYGLLLERKVIKCSIPFIEEKK